MECAKCKRQYKSQKTLDQHIIRMHSSVEEVVPEVVPEVVAEVEPSESKDDLTSEHECNNCNKCKDELKLLNLTTKLLILRYSDMVKFAKDVNENAAKNHENFKIAFDNFEYFNDTINKMMIDIDILMNEHNKKSNDKKYVIIKKRKSKK